MKLYLNPNYDEHVMPLSEWCDLLETEIEAESIIIEECKRDKGGPMHCLQEDFFPEKGDCGRACKQYKPCNGKSGRCRHLASGYIGTGKLFQLNRKGELLEVKP